MNEFEFEYFYVLSLVSRLPICFRRYRFRWPMKVFYVTSNNILFYANNNNVLKFKIHLIKNLSFPSLPDMGHLTIKT